MSIPITCDCGRYFEVPEAIAGSRVRCPDCGRELTVTKPASQRSGVRLVGPANRTQKRQGNREPRAGQHVLYLKFYLDEPWDSPHNLALVARMPRVYNCPGHSTRKSGMTGYLAVVGESTAFRPDRKPVRLQDITDGADRTILVGESLRSVPWTKPEDLPFDMNLPLFGLGSRHGYHDNGFNVVFANSSVHFLKSSIDPTLLRTLLLRDDIQMVGPDSY